MQMRLFSAPASLSFAVTLLLALPSHAQTATVPSPPGTTGTLTLTDALSLAYQSSPRLAAQRAALRAVDEDVARALAGWRPQIGVTGSYGYAEQSIPFVSLPNGHPWDVTVTVTQPIFGPTTIPETRQAKANVRAGRAQLTSVEQSVLLAAATAYFNVAGAESTVASRQMNVDLLTDQLQGLEQRAAIGDVTQSDVALARARLTASQADLAIAQANLASARAELARAIGPATGAPEMNPTLPPTPMAEVEAIDRAIAGNPDLAAAREQASAADAAVGVAVGGLLPSLSLQGQYRKSHDEVATGINESATSVMAQLRVPIYQGGAEYASVRRAKETRSNALLTIADVQRQVTNNVQTAWAAELAARQAIALHEQQVQAAQAAYDGYAQAFRAGQVTTFDLLNSAQELVSAQIALADARRQYGVETFTLLSSTGDLTARALNLPVMMYDPQLHYDRDATRWIGLGD